jgi:hypothetical protein
VLKGRVTALGSVVVLMVLTAGAAGLSLATSTRASAALTLRQAVEATLASRSFTIDVTDNAYGIRSTEVFVYEAPNRCEYISYSNLPQVGREEPYRVLQTVTIGRSEYWRNDASDLWSRGQLVEPTFCANWQDAWLTPLLEGTESSESRDSFRSYTAPYVIQQASGPKWKYSKVATTVLRDGKVVSEDIVTSFVSPVDRLHDTVVAQEQVTLGAFGTSPPVVAPPASEVTG